MIGRRRRSAGPAVLELPERARAAARSVGGAVSVPRGGLARVLARALGRGEPPPAEDSLALEDLEKHEVDVAQVRLVMPHGAVLTHVTDEWLPVSNIHDATHR